MARNYHTLRAGSLASEKQLHTFLMKNGQQLLPMVQLIEQSRVAIDELVDTIGRVTIDTILEMSAEQVAGPRGSKANGAGINPWCGTASSQGKSTSVTASLR